jgi:tRNA(fMet)-specific endonuclease VapC
VAVKIALDTNAYADWKKGVRWQREISEGDEIHISATVLGELYYGFACGDRQVKNLGELELLLDAPCVCVDLITKETAACYGDLKKYLRRNGIPIPDNDIWIAAACIEHGATLLTSDKHFERLPQVRVARRDG